MKSQKIFFMLAAAVALSAGVSSCTNDDRELQCADGRTPITLVSSVGGSRAADVNLQRTQIAAGVQTGVFVTNDARTVADNVPLTADGAGSFTGSEMYYPEDGSAVSVYAYAPYNGSWMGTLGSDNTFAVASDQSTEDGYLASDLLWGIPEGENSFTSSASPIALTFAHKLSKLNVTFDTGETDVNLQGATVTVVNTLPSVTLNVEDGALGAASGSATEITAVKFAADASAFQASAVIVPQTVQAGAFIKVVTADGDEYTAELEAATAFEEGKVYTYTVKFGGSEPVQVELVLGGIITDWEDGNPDLGGDAKGEQPVVDRVSHTLAKAGERIRIYGSHFKNVKRVVFPGEAEAATVVATGSELDTQGEIWIHSDDNYEMIDVIVPEGGDQTSGALYVEAEKGNGGYSYAYMNCKDNVFISEFNGANDAYGYGSGNISQNNALTPANAAAAPWPAAPAQYRAFPNTADGIDFIEGTASISGDFNFTFVVDEMMAKAPESITSCDDLAVQFDCFMEHDGNQTTWTAGAMRFGLGNFTRPEGVTNTDRDIQFTPWHPAYGQPYADVDADFSNGWKTLTFPLKDYANVQGKTVGDFTGNGTFKFQFGSFTYPTFGASNYEAGSDMNGFLIYFGNFRIVSYTKPATE